MGKRLDETTFRILDILARDLGKQTSIRALAEKVREKYGSGYYANVYNKLQQLAQEKTVNLANVGKNWLVTLYFKDYLIADKLTEMEIRKKQDLLKGRPELGMLFQELDTYLHDMVFVRSISVIDAEKNLRLNRVELLILLRGHGTSLFPDESEVGLVRTTIQMLQSIHGFKIDYLILTDQKLLDSLATDEHNPVKEMMRDRITFFGPQAFWHVIRVGHEIGLSLEASGEETVPVKITEADLMYNLAGFGYKEMGVEISGGAKMCIEYTVAGVLMQRDIRRIEAIPVILAKQKDHVNYDVLFFLASKYNYTGMLLGLLKAYVSIRPDKRAKDAIELMAELKVKEVTMDKEAIQEKMKLYDAIG